MNKSKVKAEIVAGITTFLAMSYIIVVNPAILSSSGTGMPFEGVMTATILASFVATLMMGLVGRLPFALAPGMGLNAFFTYTLVIGDKIPWQQALGLVFWAGIIFLLISVFPIRSYLFSSIPENLRHAMGVGIGLFLTFIGLQKAGIIVSHPATLVTLSKPNANHFLFFFGLGLTYFLLMRKSIFALISGILGISVVSHFFFIPISLENVISTPDFSSTIFKLDIIGCLKLIWIPSMFAFVITDFFDTLSAFIGMSHSANLIESNGEPKNLKKGLIVDSVATIFSGLMGTSPTTTYIESGAGIEAGGRTGLTAIVCAFCFLPFLFFAPLLKTIPAVALAPVLVVVGCLMFKNIKSINFSEFENAVPAFFIIVMIPLTYSITEGIVWGLFSHVLLYVLKGRAKEVSLGMWILTIMSVVSILI